MTQVQIREYLMANGVAAFAQPGRGDDGTVFVSGAGRGGGGGGSSPTLVMAAEHYNRIFRILKKVSPLPWKSRLEIPLRMNTKRITM